MMASQRRDRVSSVCLKKSLFSLDQPFAARSFFVSYPERRNLGRIINYPCLNVRTSLVSHSSGSNLRIPNLISPGWYHNWQTPHLKGGYNSKKTQLILNRKPAFSIPLVPKTNGLERLQTVDFPNRLELPVFSSSTGMYQIRLKNQAGRNGAADENSR